MTHILTTVLVALMFGFAPAAAAPQKCFIFCSPQQQHRATAPTSKSKPESAEPAETTMPSPEFCLAVEQAFHTLHGADLGTFVSSIRGPVKRREALQCLTNQ